MGFPTPMMQSRRRFLTTISLAGAASLFRVPRALAGEGALETTTVRLPKTFGICVAPQYVADELLRAEGFTDVRYVATGTGNAPGGIARGEIDFGSNFAPVLITALDRGIPITALGPLHVGCFEVFGNEGLHSIIDLKGKSVAVEALGSPTHLFLSVIAANIGIDPGKDINWVTSGSVRPMQLFMDGKSDAFLGLPPEPQELRARHIGHVLLDSAVDRPYSHYICCLLIGSRDYVRNYPVATKRVLRAILKANELCAAEPARAAQRLVDDGFTGRFDYALQTLTELPYDKWRDYDPEDSVRFYALRLREAGMTKSSPQKIIADGTDWRFLNELKRELKA
jgi:NitT/TauT family transport system substrate-binding protein